VNAIKPASPAGQLTPTPGLATKARSESTKANYRVSAAHFVVWCRQSGLEPLPAAPKTVAEYLEAEHYAHRAMATIRLRAAAIAEAHRLASLPNPCEAKLVADTLRGIARTHREDKRRQRQAPGLTQEDETIITHTLGASNRPKDVRDLALLLVGRELLSRSSELVGITHDDIEFDEEDGTAWVTLTRLKGNKDAEPLFIGQDATAALRRWLEFARVVSGPVFVGLTKGGKLARPTERTRPDGRRSLDKEGNELVPLTRRDVGRILKSLAKSSGLSADFSGHSLRVGMAQDLVAEGYETAGIMQAAGWTSPTMLARYTKKQDRKKRGVMAKRDAARHK
jgi:site-specific recombinase XerD